MTCRHAVFHLALICIAAVCSTSLADTPLVIAELDAQRRIAEADASRAKAEQELAAWTFEKLRELRAGGHASWQEEVEQEVKAKSAAAVAASAEQYLQTVLDWQARLAKLNLPPTNIESENIGLYMPGSARLVAWMSTEVAGLELAKQHLETLRLEHQSAASIDLSELETAINKARLAVEVYGRSNRDADLRRRAEIQLRLAEAEHEHAEARKAEADIIARRIALVSKSLSKQKPQGEESAAGLAQVGTRLVDATSRPDLAALVTVMAIDQSIATEQMAWLEQQRDDIAARIVSLEKLSQQHPLADHGELDQARQQQVDLESQLQQAVSVLNLQKQIAGNYERKLSPSTDTTTAHTPLTLDEAPLSNPSVVRHLLGLTKLELQTAANRAAVAAESEYLVERLKRVEQIPVRARPPHELDHMRNKVEAVTGQLKLVDHQLVLLDREQRRFRHQVESQRGEHYQLVQAGNGEFIPREQFEIGGAPIATVGFVGNTGLFPDDCCGAFPYIESTYVLDCLSQLSLQTPSPTGVTFRPITWGATYPLLRQSYRSSVRGTRYATSGLMLASDRIRPAWIRSGASLSIDEPYGWQRIENGWWGSANELYDARSCEMQYCDPYCRRSFYPPSFFTPSFHPPSYFTPPYYRPPFAAFCAGALSYRVGIPTRSSFPYRSSYLYRTAFPNRSNLYCSPYSPACPTYSSFGSAWGRCGSCFD